METLGLPEALTRGLEWQRQSGAVIVHVVSAESDSVTTLVDKVVVNGRGETAGAFPPAIHTAAVNAARDALAKGRSRIYSLRASDSGGEVVGIQGGDVDIFAEVLKSPSALVIAGAGHIAQPLAVVGKLLGFTVTVIDDRPEFANQPRFPDVDAIKVTEFVAGLESTRIDSETFVVLVTRGHAHDLACLRFVLLTDVAYVGMIGSKMRIRTVMRALRKEGFPEDQLRRVYAPVGIDIGSHTPAEIAVAIAAEIVDVYRQGNAPHLSLQESGNE